MEYTPKKAAEERSVNRAEIPDPRDRVWVVIISTYELRCDPEDENTDIVALTPLYALAPKSGGPASVYDKTTWYDRSMARQRQGIVYEKLLKDRRSPLQQQMLRLGFASGERFYWSDGTPVDGGRVERRRAS